MRDLLQWLACTRSSWRPARCLDQLAEASIWCIYVCMRTTLNLDDELLSAALRETRAKTKTEVIEMGLRLILEREARRRLKALRGRVPDLEEVSRRRP